MSIGSSSPKFKDIIIAVHGIGQQRRYSTVRSVATRLAASKTLLEGTHDPGRPVAPQPLGYFHSEVKGISATPLDFATYLGTTHLATTGFAEVFWADITEKAIKEGSTMEETMAWGRTVVARAHALWHQSEAAKQSNTRGETNVRRGIVAAQAHALLMRLQPRIVSPNFALATEVLDEILETVYVLKNLSFLADKAGLFKFDLTQVLEDYMGGVQIVTEFADYRDEIISRFHLAMAGIYAEQCDKGNDKVRFHIVAHSEGTVISFLGLLQALSGQQWTTSTSQNDRPHLKNTNRIPEWLKHVHGFMTIGSPIDKHLLLWPQLWETLYPTIAERRGLLAGLPAGQIRWRNYYDYGDPVGFKLDTARRWLDLKKSKAFEFKHQHDIGFARYLMPGKAHIDYWNDSDVFEHFVDDVIIPKKDAKLPTDKPAIRFLSPTLPYVFSAAVLVIGVYLLCKAVVNFTHPDDPITKYFLITKIGVDPTPGVSGWALFLNTLGIAGLIAGTTLFARLPRLAAGRSWKIVGLVAFVTGCVLYASLVCGPSQREIGNIFLSLVGHITVTDKAEILKAEILNTFSFVKRLVFGSPITDDDKVTILATAGIVSLSLVVGVCGLWATRRSKQDKDKKAGEDQKGDEDRRQRWILKGMRPLILCGACAVVPIVISQICPHKTELTADDIQKHKLTSKQSDIIKAASFDRNELDQLFKAKPDQLDSITQVKPFLSKRPPMWPVLLAVAGFLYLWWLAALIFDLAFVWHRYVRHSVANQRLREWGPQDLRRLDGDRDQHEKCRISE